MTKDYDGYAICAYPFCNYVVKNVTKINDNRVKRY